jgi:hypothetical protein
MEGRDSSGGAMTVLGPGNAPAVFVALLGTVLAAEAIERCGLRCSIRMHRMLDRGLNPVKALANTEPRWRRRGFFLRGQKANVSACRMAMNRPKITVQSASDSSKITTIACPLLNG